MIHNNIKAVTANFECPNIITVDMEFSSACPMTEYMCLVVFVDDTMFVAASSDVALVTPDDRSVRFMLRLSEEFRDGDYTATFLHYPKPQPGESIYNLPDGSMEFRTIANYTFTKGRREEVRMRRFKSWMEESYGVNWDCEFAHRWQQQIEAAEAVPQPAIDPEAVKNKAITLLLDALRQEANSWPTPMQEMELAMQELNALTGLDDVKRTMERLFHMRMFNRMRSRHGLPAVQKGLPHFIFLGNPGTGKTTVARLIGKLFHAMGLLSTDEVLCHDRHTLLGQYIGETENNMKEILREAEDKVLLIDEAYALLTQTSDSKDYGRHVVETLLTAITDPDCRTVFILAGYTDEMQKLIDSNPGLASRFPYHFHFPDFTDDDLLAMAYQLLIDARLELTPEAEKQLEATVAEATSYRGDNFGNGRWLNNFMREGVIPAMAERLMAGKMAECQMSVSGKPSIASLSEADLTFITAEDIRCAANADVHIANVRRHARPIHRMGFVAA